MPEIPPDGAATPTPPERFPNYAGRLREMMRAYHAQVNSRVDATLADLEQRWNAPRAALANTIAQLEREMRQAQDAGDTLTYAWLAEADRLARLKASVAGDVQAFAEGARQVVGASQTDAIGMGSTAAQEALAATVPPGTSFTFGVPPEDVTAELAGALQPGSPLASLFDGFGATAAQFAQQALFTSVALGENPRVAAQRLEWATNMSARRAETIARTETLRAWRGAQMANYRANSDVVQQWMWSCDFGPRSCFPASTLVQTRRGLIPIEQVRVGDEALTHTGRYRPVLGVMCRDYEGALMTLAADGRAVTATSDHPFLVEWQGQLNWVEAGWLPLGARVVCQIEGGAQVGDHTLGQRPIERRVRQTHDTIAQTLQSQRLTRILRTGSWRRVPVHAVNLQDGIAGRQMEVGRIAPARHGELLLEEDAQLLQTASRVGLWLGLARVATIALRRAEATSRQTARLRAYFLATGQAGKRVRRAATFLRAVAAIGGTTKDHAAAQAGMQDVLRVPVVALARAVVTLARIARVGVKRLATHDARHLRMARRLVALPRTMHPLGLAGAHREAFAAVNAGALDAGFGFHASAGMGMLSLMRGVADARAETSAASTRPGVRDGKGFVTFDAKLFHTTIVTQSVIHIQSSMPVYNLEVADDHSYVAGGFVVHNCGACIAMDGTYHPLEEELDDHICGRCSALPVTLPWSQILSDAGVPQDTIDDLALNETSLAAQGGQTASDWFATQSAELQNSILGPAKAEAYRQGDLALSDLINYTYSPEWGWSLRESSMAELGLDPQQYLADVRAAQAETPPAPGQQAQAVERALSEWEQQRAAAIAQVAARDAAAQAEAQAARPTEWEQQRQAMIDGQTPQGEQTANVLPDTASPFGTVDEIRARQDAIESRYNIPLGDPTMMERENPEAAAVGIAEMDKMMGRLADELQGNRAFMKLAREFGYDADQVAAHMTIWENALRGVANGSKWITEEDRALAAMSRDEAKAWAKREALKGSIYDMLSQYHSAPPADGNITLWNSDPFQVAVLEATAREFGITAAHDYYSAEQLEQAMEIYGPTMKGIQTWLRQMHTDTQAWFAEQGISEVQVFRGLRWNAGDQPAGVAWGQGMTENPVSAQPIASWATHAEVAYDYASGTGMNFFADERPDYSMVLVSSVPVEQVLSVGYTGLGSTPLRETMVMPGDYRVHAIPFAPGEAPGVDAVYQLMAGQGAQ